jgi:hypothetical protein
VPKYHGSFTCREDIVAIYGDRVPPEPDIVYACMSEPDYEESLIVVFARDGRLFEIADSHCSCNGWDEDGDTWDAPDEVLVQQLLTRASGAFGRAIAEWLERVEAARPVPSAPRVLRRALSLR